MESENRSLKVVGFRHTGIIVSNLENSLNFYHKILGLEMVQEHTDSSAYISKITKLPSLTAKYAKLRIPGGAIIELLTYPSHPTSKAVSMLHQVGEAHLAFAVESAANSFSALKRNGIVCLSEPVLSSEKIAKVFFCLDPDNYRVEIVEMLEFPKA
jgi:catechol 2,3-dioxygenase-like lactoylglutathione lyase family enzyme